MATFTKADFKTAYKLFRFAGQIKLRPYNLTLDPYSKIIVDNALTDKRYVLGLSSSSIWSTTWVPTTTAGGSQLQFPYWDNFYKGNV